MCVDFESKNTETRVIWWPLHQSSRQQAVAQTLSLAPISQTGADDKHFVI